MGKAIWGPSGPVTGRVGNLIYYRVNGEGRVRTTRKITTPPTLGQLKTRQEMRVVNQFLKLLTEVLNVGFKHIAKRTQSPYNAATSYHIRNAMTGVYPDIAIDYSKVMISFGNIEVADGMVVVLTAGGLQFSWNGGFPGYYPRPDDQALLLAYFPEQNRAVYALFGAKRSQGTAMLILPDDLMDQPMVVYMAFASADRTKVSDSRFLGWVNE